MDLKQDFVREQGSEGCSGGQRTQVHGRVGESKASERRCLDLS